MYDYYYYYFFATIIFCIILVLIKATKNIATGKEYRIGEFKKPF